GSTITLELSQTLSDWLMYHYIPAVALTCVLLALATALASRRIIAPAAQEIQVPATVPQPTALREGLLMLMIIGLGCYAWLMIAWEEFTFYDAHIFFQSLAGGPQYALLQLFPPLGRAYPLTHQEFYPLSFIGNSAAVYQVFSFLQVLLGGLLLSRLLRGSLPIAVLTFTAILLAPPVVAALFHIVNSERNILLLLCVFLWSSLAYERSHRTGYLVLAGIASFVSLQYK